MAKPLTETVPKRDMDPPVVSGPVTAKSKRLAEPSTVDDVVIWVPVKLVLAPKTIKPL